MNRDLLGPLVFLGGVVLVGLLSRMAYSWWHRKQLQPPTAQQLRQHRKTHRLTQRTMRHTPV